MFKNKAKCLKCGDIIESKHVHDFIWCKCKTIFIDGGNDYWKGGGNLECFERIFEEIYKEKVEKLAQNIKGE